MSDYVPTAADIINGSYHLGDNLWRELTEAEVARGIARIKAEAAAEALREAATETRGAAPDEPWAGATYTGFADWLAERADQIDREAGL